MTDYSTRDTQGIPATPHGEVVGEVDAKQGRRGYHVLAVLLASLALVVIAFAALFIYSARPFTPQPAAQPKTTAPYSTP